MSNKIQSMDRAVPNRPAALLFDMDGTLTVPVLDFEQIRCDVGVDGPILEAIEALDADRQAQAWRVLHDHEARAARESELDVEAKSILNLAHQNRIPVALITRNTPASVRTVLEKHNLHFDVVITRLEKPIKPAPDPIHLACHRLGVKAAQSWMIGDGDHDITAGNAAGATTIWISHGRTRRFDARPTLTLARLGDLADVLRAACRPGVSRV